MKNPRVPKQLCGMVLDLRSAYVRVAGQLGIYEEEAVRLYDLVPRLVQLAPAFLDRLTGKWRYDFGRPINRLPGGYIVLGAQMFTLVEHLVRATRLMDRWLDKRQLRQVVERLAIEEKHQDVLAEFSPLLFVGEGVNAQFEVTGFGAGTKTVDWLVRSSTVLILIEVKTRKLDLIEGLFDIIKAQFKVGPPQHDPQLLFRGTVEKYQATSPVTQLQGAWIITELMQERSRLHQVFESLDASRLHFAVLANWSQDAYVLVRKDVDPNLITSTFGITHSDRWVFHLPPTQAEHLVSPATHSTLPGASG